MSETRKNLKNDNGFTLVELMVTVFLTAIAVISIYRGYTSFSQAADAQQQIMEMQQNLRIGMSRLVTDIRRAGMNEEDETDAGFLAADAASIEFSMDLGSGGVYASDGVDNDDDGIKDAADEDESRIGDGDTCDDGEKIRYTFSGGALLREVRDATLPCSPISGGYGAAQTIITNVEALDFVYFNDTSATPLARPLNAADLAEVDRVEVTLVVRATNEDFRYTDRMPYQNLQGTVVYDPVTDAAPAYIDPDTGYLRDDRHVRRRVFSMSVQIRNNI